MHGVLEYLSDFFLDVMIGEIGTWVFGNDTSEDSLLCGPKSFYGARANPEARKSAAAEQAHAVSAGFVEVSLWIGISPS
jgi:hypothetical protein